MQHQPVDCDQQPTAWRRPVRDTISRRRFLGTAALLGVGALAGCGGERDVRTFEFEASSTALSKAERLGLSERLAEKQTWEHSKRFEGFRAEITIHDAVAAYEHHSPETPLLLDFVDNAAAPGSGDAVVVPAEDLGFTATALSAGLWSSLGVPLERVGLVAPEGARADGEVTLDEMLALVPGDAAASTELSVDPSLGAGWRLAPADVLPSTFYVPEAFYVPDAICQAGSRRLWASRRAASCS